jgi:hypothetical protein
LLPVFYCARMAAGRNQVLQVFPKGEVDQRVGPEKGRLGISTAVRSALQQSCGGETHEQCRCERWFNMDSSHV